MSFITIIAIMLSVVFTYLLIITIKNDCGLILTKVKDIQNNIPKWEIRFSVDEIVDPDYKGLVQSFSWMPEVESMYRMPFPPNVGDEFWMLSTDDDRIQKRYHCRVTRVFHNHQYGFTLVHMQCFHVENSK